MNLPADTMARFEARYVPEPNSGCWLWLHGGGRQGYGSLPVNGKSVRASRVSWVLHRGPIPDGLLVCHKCDTPACVNPAHLFLGTVRDNALDMVAKGRQGWQGFVERNMIKTHCPKGHPLSDDNIAPSKQGWRRCAICKRAWDSANRHLRRQGDHDAGVAAERARIVDIIRRWQPYAGVWSARDMANFVERGDELPDDGTEHAPTPAHPAQEPARQGEALPFLAWVYEVSPGQHALLTEAEVRRIGLPAYSINGPMPRPLPPAAKEK